MMGMMGITMMGMMRMMGMMQYLSRNYYIYIIIYPSKKKKK